MVGYPGTIDDVQHAWLGRLGRDIEPGGGGQVEPGVRHEVRMIQEQSPVIKHRLTELTIVEVVTQLLGSSTIVLPPLARPRTT